MGLSYCTLPYDSPLRLPLMEALLSSERIFTVKIDLLLRLDANGIACNLNSCGALSGTIGADLNRRLDACRETIYDKLQVEPLSVKVDRVERFGFNALFSMNPKICLTISSYYETESQTESLDFRNRAIKASRPEG